MEDGLYGFIFISALGRLLSTSHHENMRTSWLKHGSPPPGTRIMLRCLGPARLQHRLWRALVNRLKRKGLIDTMPPCCDR